MREITNKTREMEAVFGEDADLIELEPEDLEEVEPTHYDLEDELEEGDEVTIVISEDDRYDGTVTEVSSVGFTTEGEDYRNGYSSYQDFVETERGINFDLEIH